MWVRENFRHCRYDIDALCELFDLTREGAERILAGGDWLAEYERPAVNYIEV